MFSKLFVLAFAAVSVVAKPVARSAETELISSDSSSGSSVSFNNYMGLSSMANFDDFFGQDNFNGASNQQTIIVQEKQVVCNTQLIEVVQQKVAVLIETMKRVILEQACEVEVQTIVVQQASSIIGSFSQDLGRQNDKQPSFDQQISSLLGQIVNQDGSLSSSNLGFGGKDIGNSSVTVGGNNWNNATSPDSVKSAKQMAQQAANSSSTDSSNSTSSANSTSSSSEKRQYFFF